MESQAPRRAYVGPVRHRVSAASEADFNLEEIIAASGISTRLWRLYAYFWLVCLAFPLLALMRTPPSGWRMLIPALGLTGFTAVYFWVMWLHPLNDRGRVRFRVGQSIGLLTALTVLGLLLIIGYGNSFLWLFIGVSAIAGIMLPTRSAFVAVILLTLLSLGAAVAAGGSIASADWLQIIPLVLLVRGLGLDMIGFLRLSDALQELHSAREELARQAVTQERLRMARDLHDLLGHTLSLITLKSELAGRLLAKEPLAATQEIHEVEHVARQALRDVREAVAGYRQPTLAGELEGARQILEAAGITFNIENTADALPADVDNVLAWVVREGVTNVIRHSRAHHCLIRVTSTGGSARAEVVNDGCPSDGAHAEEAGSGLTGLAERVANRGGRMDAGPQLTGDAQGYRLRVEIPTRKLLPAEAR